MAYAPHFRVSFGGSLAEPSAPAYGPEIWACNVNVVAYGTPANGGTQTGFDPDAYLAQIATPLATWFHATASNNSANARMEYVKCNLVGADGRYSDKTTTHRHDYNPFPVGGTSPVNPDIISVCTSWATSKARGPGSHGRIYLPNPTMGGGTAMFITDAEAISQVAAGVALLHVLNNSGGSATAQPVVASNVDGTNTDIIEVKVGSVKDVQRRRKDQLVESYKVGIFLSAN